MPQGDKSAYTSKQKRQARDIEKGYERRGVSEKESARRAWATVNKQTGGGLKGKTAKVARKKTSAMKTAAKKTATKKTAGKRAVKKAAKKTTRRSVR